jgi:hypothetical protein
MSDQNPVFVLGCPRSGNTLVGSLLNKHRDFLIFFEANIFNSFYLKWNARNASQRPVEDFVALTQKEFAKYHHKFSISLSDVREAVADRSPDWARMTESYIRLLVSRSKPEARRWGDKTPHHVAFMEDIVREYPGAQFVFVYRDPPHVVTSLSKPSFPFTSNSAIENAAVVQQYLDTYESQRKTVDPASIYELRYEDLLARPEAEARKLCDFLGVSYHEEMIGKADARIRRIIGWPNNKAWDEISPQETSRPPQKSSFVEAYLDSWMDRLGYDRAHADAGPLATWTNELLAQLSLLPFHVLKRAAEVYFQRKYNTERRYIMLKRPSLSDALGHIHRKIRTPEQHA